MKQVIIILAIIIALLTMTTVIFINIFFFSEASLPSSEPKREAVVQEMPKAGPGEPSPSIPGTKEKPQPSYVMPPARIPTPQEIEERINKEDERRKALEEMRLKTERQNESIRAEAFRKLKEAEAVLLSTKTEEPNQPAAAVLPEKNTKH